MKCPICKKGTMNKVVDFIKQDNIEFGTFKCNNCSEKLMNGKQLKNLASKYRQLRMAKVVSFAKWGNSIAIRIPNEFIKDYNIRPGKQARLIKEKNSIRITP